MIGINYAKAAEDGVEGMGYAIPIDEAMEILQELMETQEGGETSQELPGYLGISVQELSEEARLLYGIPMGIFVSQVGENGPAQKAGLQQGDVISKIAGYSITDQSDLQELMPYLFQEIPLQLNITGLWMESMGSIKQRLLWKHSQRMRTKEGLINQNQGAEAAGDKVWKIRKKKNTKNMFYVPETGEQGREDDFPAQSHLRLPGLYAESL